MRCHFILQGIFLTQGWTPHLFHLLHWHVGSLPWVPPGKPLNKLCCWWPKDCNTPGFCDLHYFPEFTQTYDHLVSDAVQPFHLCSCLLLLPSVFLNIKVFSSECVVISYCDSKLHFSNKIMILKVFLCTCIVQLLSHGWLSATPWTVALQSPLSMGLSRQEYWSGLLFSSPGGSFQPRNQSWVFCIADRFFTVWANIPGHLYCHMNYRITLSVSKRKKINQLINQSCWDLNCSEFIDLLWENWINSTASSNP